MKKKGQKIVQTRGKKKSVIARLKMKEGYGTIKINGSLLQALKPKLACNIIYEPIKLAEDVLGKNFLDNLSIEITVNGGGIMGQAFACRTAIGKALLKWNENENLKKLFNEYDRSIFIDDVRRCEAKKPLRKGARARPTKSYR